MKIYNDLRNVFLFFWIKKTRDFKVGERLYLRGRPIIDIRDGGRIEIGDDVTLNSQNYGYHISMYSPVKLFANITKGAIVKIGNKTRIHGSCIHARERIEIGNNCLVAGNCQIFDCSAHHISFDDPPNRINTPGTTKPIIIEDNVWIGANCIILPGVRIGYGSIIGAGSVVTKNIPPMAIAAGNPAEVIKTAEYKVWKDDKTDVK